MLLAKTQSRISEKKKHYPGSPTDQSAAGSRENQKEVPAKRKSHDIHFENSGDTRTGLTVSKCGSTSKVP